MSKCKERDFTEVAKIEVCEQGALQIRFPLFAPEVSVAASTLGTAYFTDVPFTAGTVKVKDSNAVGVGGFSHVVSVEWGMDADTDASLLVSLQNRPHEIMITYFGGARKLMRTDRTGYKFTFQHEDGALNCSMTLVNGQGLIALL